jgi:hypothetical protein
MRCKLAANLLWGPGEPAEEPVTSSSVESLSDSNASLEFSPGAQISSCFEPWAQNKRATDRRKLLAPWHVTVGHGLLLQSLSVQPL